MVFSAAASESIWVTAETSDRMVMTVVNSPALSVPAGLVIGLVERSNFLKQGSSEAA